VVSILFLKIVKKKDDIYNSPHSQSLFKFCTACFRKDIDILKRALYLDFFLTYLIYIFHSTEVHKTLPCSTKIFRALSVSVSSNLRTQRAGCQVSFCERIKKSNYNTAGHCRGVCEQFTLFGFKLFLLSLI
jgi:hypothetical protein